MSVYASEEYFQQLLVKAVSAHASDVHFKVGIAPGARVNGDMIFFRTDPLNIEDTKSIVKHLLKHIDPESKKEHDLAYRASVAFA